MRRQRAVALALLVLLGACTDDGPSDEGDPPSVTTTSVLQTDAAVRVGELLLTDDDLGGTGFEAEVASAPFTAERAPRIRLCDQDLRTDLRLVSGRQARFSNGSVEVAHVVTSGGDTLALLDRFREVVESCPGPWGEPPLPTGGGPLQREITGAYPVLDVGLDAAGVVVRSRNEAGSSDTIIVVMVSGAVVSSLSISGALGANFDVVDTAVEAAATKLIEAQSTAEP